jgi:predicted nucleic-acid-binding Zn-ribbon protein
MSSVLDLIECRQCGYKEADYEYYCRVGEDVTTCRRCGYHESWTVKRDQEGSPCGWTNEINLGFGALWYGKKRVGGNSPIAACTRRQCCLMLNGGCASG